MKNISINDVHLTDVDGSKVVVRYCPGQSDSLILFIHGLLIRKTVST